MTSNSHDAVVQYGLELYNLAQTFDRASGLQILYFFCISFPLYYTTRLSFLIVATKFPHCRVRISPRTSFSCFKSVGKSLLLMGTVPQAYVSLYSKSCIKSVEVKKLSKKKWFTECPSNIITQTFELKQFTVRPIFTQVDLEPRNIVVISVGKHPNFNTKLIWLHGHVLFGREPAVKLYKTLVNANILSRNLSIGKLIF